MSIEVLPRPVLAHSPRLVINEAPGRGYSPRLVIRYSQRSRNSGPTKVQGTSQSGSKKSKKNLLGRKRPNKVLLGQKKDQENMNK